MKKVAAPFQPKVLEGKNRTAGILLHVTSLPSDYGIGDIGPQAYLFADFLHRSKQSYWQLLPLGPIEKDQGYSPYSSTSSMAGNTLLISPELLAEEKLLTPNDLEKSRVRSQAKVDYEGALEVKSKLFEKAFKRFGTKATALNQQYKKFIQREKFWLDDYAAYVVLKKHHDGKPWYEWPLEYKLKDEKSIRKVLREYGDEVEKEKWLQFIFSYQWNKLREYCNEKGIALFGDLPFYVSYDSADVWAHPELFELDKNKNITAVAGVPPDYFNEDGQLWGMPIYRWKTLKRTNYDWWVKRLQKNIELFDVVRLDHFRAFADYWEVRAGEKTAKNGEWKPGPGASLFLTVEKALGTLPFIAEDLGDINQPVYDLRDQFGFPGMKVLHFAFSDNISTSDYIPHNYTSNFIAYTGTHDNNTTVGWFKKDVSKAEKANLINYLGKRITEENVHIELARLAYMSIASTVIVPMQDVLGLDEGARINKPASIENNWQWQLKPGQMKLKDVEERLKQWAALYSRG